MAYISSNKCPLTKEAQMKLDALRQRGMTVTSHDGNVIGSFTNSRDVGKARQNSDQSPRLDSSDSSGDTTEQEVPFEPQESSED